MLAHLLMVSGEFPIYRAETKILPSMHTYGDLSKAEGHARFMKDFLRSRQFARSGLRENELRAAVSECHDYCDFLAVFMDQMALSQDKARWVEKTPENVCFLDVLAKRFTSARFIHIVRDGRDVALSFRRLGWTPNFGGDLLIQLLWAGEFWRYMLASVRRHAPALDDRYLEIRYEDLILEPEASLSRIARFGEIALDAATVKSSQFGSLGRANTAFSDTSGALAKEPVYRWKDQMSEPERQRLTLSLRRELENFGYEVPEIRLGSWDRTKIRALGNWLQASVRLKESLREKTPLGRRSGSPFEIGLD